VALDVESGPVEPQRSAIADVVEALMLTARAWRQRFGPEPIGP